MAKNGEYVAIIPPEEYPGLKFNKNRYCYEHHYVWWKNTGEIISGSDFLIHHKNGDKHDNHFNNLEKMKRSSHTKIHNKKPLVGVFKCPVCGKIFKREKRRVYTHMKKNRPVLCSRNCGGKIYGSGQKKKYNFKIIEWK